MIRGFSPLMTVIVFAVLWVGAYVTLHHFVPRMTETRKKALINSFAAAATTFFLVLFTLYFISLTK